MLGRMAKRGVESPAHIGGHRFANADRLAGPARECSDRSHLLPEPSTPAAIEKVQSQAERLTRRQSRIQGPINGLGMFAAGLLHRAGDIAKECDEGVHE
jgi:hypothetical protein